MEEKRTIILDFSGIKTCWELHEYFKTVFELPDYYGRNMDALWDCLRCSFEVPTKITLKNIYAMSKELHPLIETIKELFRDLEEEEAEVTVQCVDEREDDLMDYSI